MNKTILMVKQTPKAPWRVLCTVTSNSNFKDMGWMTKADLNDPDNQLRAAREQRDGWKHNGPWPNAKFRIEDHNGTVIEEQK